MKYWIFLVLAWAPAMAVCQQPIAYPVLPPPSGTAIRVATFNASLNRKNEGDLMRDVESGDPQIADIARIVQCVAPDVLLMNEVDYAESHAELIRTKFLPFFGESFSAPVNTGVPSGLDINRNGRVGEADDAWGFGAFPGQYGMVIFSRFPIDRDRVRTFQTLLWSDMPGALRPENETGYFHSDAIWKQLRLSSKSHWDVPIRIGDRTLHVLASHPTPPVFDGPEDRNGCRNHDEIRLWADYLSGGKDAEYLVDDRGQRGGLDPDAVFVILGDLNADPLDGDGKHAGIAKLLSHPRLARGPVPASRGGTEAARGSGQANASHRGDPAHDTGDFNDRNPGNLRIDYVLPSAQCRIVDAGVYWPASDESSAGNRLVQASDHRLVWVDFELH